MIPGRNATMDAAPSTAAPVPDETIRNGNHLLRQQDTSTGRVRKSTLQLHFPASPYPPGRGSRVATVAPFFAWRRRDMGSRNLKVYPVPETFLDGNFKPSKQFRQIQMIKSSQRIELVLPGNSFLFSMSANRLMCIIKLGHHEPPRAHSSQSRRHGMSAQVAHGPGAVAIRAAWVPPCGRVLSARQPTPELPFYEYIDTVLFSPALNSLTLISFSTDLIARLAA